MPCTYSGRLEPVVRVWDGAGRCNRRARGERCFLIEMDRAVFVDKWTDRRAEIPTGRGRHTDRHHETTRPGLRTDRLSAGAGNRQSRQTIARHRRRHRPGQGTQDGILSFRLRHAENSWGAELSFGSNIGRLRGASGASPKHRQMDGTDSSADGQTDRAQRQTTDTP